MQGMWRNFVYNCAQWKILVKEEKRGELMMMLSKVEDVTRLPPLLLWPEPD
jgi:hypothetical protein